MQKVWWFQALLKWGQQSLCLSCCPLPPGLLGVFSWQGLLLSDCTRSQTACGLCSHLTSYVVLQRKGSAFSRETWRHGHSIVSTMAGHTFKDITFVTELVYYSQSVSIHSFLSNVVYRTLFLGLNMFSFFINLSQKYILKNFILASKLCLQFDKMRWKCFVKV